MATRKVGFEAITGLLIVALIVAICTVGGYAYIFFMGAMLVVLQGCMMSRIAKPPWTRTLALSSGSIIAFFIVVTIVALVQGWSPSPKEASLPILSILGSILPYTSAEAWFKT